MLDIKYIRENPDKVKENALNKGVEVDEAIDKILEVEEKRRTLTADLQVIEEKNNAVNKVLQWLWPAAAKREKNQPIGITPSELGAKLAESFTQVDKTLNDNALRDNWKRNVEPFLAQDPMQALVNAPIVFRSVTKELRDSAVQPRVDRDYAEKQRDKLSLLIPNIAMDDVPVGGAEANRLLREWGDEVCKVGAKPHWDIGDALGILDTKLAAKLAGSNFALFRGAGAKLVRALMQFMLDTHSASGYVEIWPPVLANREVMTGTGQLPKFEEDMYQVDNAELFLIPTAEVPLTAMHGGEILQFTDLPLKYCAYTPCFRREAGAYGRETRGLLRVHQFDKVEILKVTTEEQAADELEGLLADAEGIIQKLGLRYRVMLLSTREMTFASERTYDIEIWSPGVQRWLEVSSVSSFGAFQARRLSLRYRDKDRKVHFCRTMNGSGVAFARLIACLLETYQREDGSVEMPEALRPYFGSANIER